VGDTLSVDVDANEPWRRVRFVFLELFRQRGDNWRCFWWSCDPLLWGVECF